MSLETLFKDHIDKLTNTYENALTHCDDLSQEWVIVHSGSEHFYFSDDRAIPFQAYGHFLQWLPVNKPDQFLLFSPGTRPKYLQVVPSDYWYEQSIDNALWWTDHFDVIRLDKTADLVRYVDADNTIYLGEEVAMAKDLIGDGAPCNPPSLVSYLDYQRAYKSEYEIDQLRLANRAALLGHQAAETAFLDGHSEYQIHQAYLNACEVLENETPYTNIVALDEKSAILHYQNKRREKADASQVLLIDAGCRINGYGSDITRTYARNTAHPVFQQLLKGMINLEQELVEEVRPDRSYVDIHLLALSKLSELLGELGIVSADVDTMIENQLTQVFMPHGVGHLLGLQVHDVAGFNQDVEGHTLAAPAHSPALRNTRTMAQEMVFTVEPGCYFIPLLLEPLRQTSEGKWINWSLVDALYSHGGIRIEDNVRVTESGAENLTRNPQRAP